MSIVGEIAKQTIIKYPKTPTKTLAQKLVKENPEVFLSVESARGVIRYYRGTIGTRCRKAASFIQPKEGEYSPFDDLPKPLTDYADWSHVALGKGRWLVFADAHIPYYHKDAFEIVLREGKNRGIDGIVMLGDIADFYSVSFWCKDPRRRDLAKERKAVLDTLGVIRDLFPDIPIIYKLGNHEERLERYLRVKAPELLDMEMLSFESIIEADKYDIQVVGDKRLITLGRLYLLHGHEFGVTFFSPVNPARGLYLRGKEIALCAHYHRSSQHTEKSLADVITSCWSIGGLCDLHPEYRPMNNWNHGFAIIDNDDEFVVTNHRIINGRVY